MVILDIILNVLKIFLALLNEYLRWTADERATKLRKINTYTSSILDTVTSNTEFLDESAYYASISQEKRVRYEKYRKEITPILLNGGGMHELSLIEVAGFQIRFNKVKDKVIGILACGQSAINRSKLISQCVVDSILE